MMSGPSRTPGIEHRVFVVGAPRSGTTLVQSLLAAHSSMTSFTESHFFDRHFTYLPLLSIPILTKNPQPRIHQFLNENGEAPLAAAAWFDASRRWTLRFRPLLPFQTRQVARRLVLILDELARRRAKSGWIEKTPRHLRYIPFLERASGPEQRLHFVHVIRNGLEVAASLYRASQNWELPYDLDTCARRWNTDVGFSLSRITAPSDSFVFYEELTSDPEATLQRLLAELDLDWEPAILERYSEISNRLITEQEDAWKANVGRRILRSDSSSRVLKEEQRQRVNGLLRRDLYDQLSQHRGAA